eukprot:Gb_17146 [translate_table: standard]
MASSHLLDLITAANISKRVYSALLHTTKRKRFGDSPLLLLASSDNDCPSIPYLIQQRRRLFDSRFGAFTSGGYPSQTCPENVGRTTSTASHCQMRPAKHISNSGDTPATKNKSKIERPAKINTESDATVSNF